MDSELSWRALFQKCALNFISTFILQFQIRSRFCNIEVFRKQQSKFVGCCCIGNHFHPILIIFHRIAGIIKNLHHLTRAQDQDEIRNHQGNVPLQARNQYFFKR
jgi:hypothetical protein